MKFLTYALDGVNQLIPVTQSYQFKCHGVRVGQPYFGKSRLIIKPLDVGGNRIQCVVMNVCEPLVLISVYMSCRGITDNYTEFKNTLDQLSVILSQYVPTHQIIIGGDLNEDITLTANGARAQPSEGLLKNLN